MQRFADGPVAVCALHRKHTQLMARRTTKWREWCNTNWATQKGLIYRYVKQSGFSGALQQLHHGTQEPPPTLSQRMDLTERHWNRFWSQGEPYQPGYSTPLPKITGEEVAAVVDHLNPKKALGADSWRPDELRKLPPPPAAPRVGGL